VEQALAVIPAGPASLMLRLGLTTSLMLVLLAQGQLRAAAALGQRLADELPVPPPPLPGAAYLVAQLGAAAYLRDALPEAERLGQQGRQLAQATQDEAAEIYALANLAFTYQALDAPASAQECLAAARAVARRFQSAAPMGAMVAGLEALLALRRGDRAAALAWAQANPLPEPPARLTPYDWHHLAGAWVLLARADWAAARQRLEQLRQAAEAGGNGAFVLLGWIGLALAEAGAGDRQAARAACEQALRLAEPEDCRRVFLDEGEPLRQVLADWLTTAGRRPEAARLAAFAAQLTAAQPPPALEALPEPLSPREREVLGLIADGLTNAEIAERLIVGLSTVKKHINAIFGKLGVTHRAQAIARARALKLV
ncbi:MAG: hypothetical protein JNK29_13075, partial [Anaerolineales bacterium]|nr:hypothetical protein [Anaerolineales bacterium]